MPSVIWRYSWSTTVCIVTALVVFTILFYIDHHIEFVLYKIKCQFESLNAKEINFDHCHLSLKESDGWFCESDENWNRRKYLHALQDKRNRNSTSRALFFQNNWEPTFHCAFEERLGNIGDGGKWVCDIHRLQRMNSSSLIYSFGSNGDFSFEQFIKMKLPSAEIHTFDLGVHKCPPNVCSFHQVRVGSALRIGTKSLTAIINELGHNQRHLEILKVDIEGSEFELFEDFLGSKMSLYDNNPNQQKVTFLPYIRQILVEIHLGSGTDEQPCIRTHRLFELFRSHNYVIFHKEANLADAPNLVEYSLIHLNPAFFNLSS